MKSHIELLQLLLEESGNRCCTSTTHDWKTIMSRVEHEGLSFLTITLPNFDKDLQKGLDQGFVDSTLFVGYSKSGCLPRFLSGFTSLVFDKQSGYLLDNPSIDAIHCIRQVSSLMGKVELPCTPARTVAAFDKFIECESQLKISDKERSEDEISSFHRMSLVLWHDVFASVDREIYEGHVIPKHGPGATADRIKGNRKYDQLQWTTRMETLFPSGEFLFPSWSHFLEYQDSVQLTDPGSEIPVRVIAVPKTLKTPRIIAVEPLCMQYAQQGILQLLVSTISRDDILGTMVGFDDQVPNQELARQGSVQGALATLDLSEASDRVSNQLVRQMVSDFPSLAEGLDVTRSRKADVPGYGVVRLAKFASMGSALCFPVEAMVFLTIVFLGIERELGYPVTKKVVKDLVGRVRIYGDDIIVPVEYVHSVVRALEDFGLLVNSGKSFWTGKFRESCGKEYYDGVDISIVKLRRMLPTQRRHVQEIISLVAFRNQLYKAGWWQTCESLDKYIEGLIPFPVVAETSPALGRHSFLGYTSERECPRLQRPLVKAYRVISKSPKSNLSGYGALLKFFLRVEREAMCELPESRESRYKGMDHLVEQSVDKEHLERAGRPDAVNIKLGWTPSY